MERINRLRQFIKKQQKKPESEHHVQPKTTTKEEMEVFQLKEDLDKARQELINGQLQLQKETSLYHVKALSQAEASYRAQIDKQRAETNRIAAALKETQELLDTERHVQTTTKEEMEVFKNLCQATVDEQLGVNSKLKAAFIKAENELKDGHLLWQQEKSSLLDQNKKASGLYHTLEEEATQMVKKDQASQVQLEEQRVEINRIAAVLKETQDLLETERHVQTTTKEEMEILKNLCQATVDEQLGVNSKLKAAFIKAENELKNGHLLWQQEKSSLRDQNKKASGLYHTLEEEATQMVKKDQASQAQLEEQRVEINRIAAVLKETQDLLETERHVQTTTKEEMEILKNLCQARVDEQLGVNSKLKAAFIKAENELKNGHLLWQQEKSSLRDQNKKACGLYHTLVKMRAESGRMEQEAKQTLQRFKAAHEGQLEEHRAETSKILAVLKKTEDQLEAERLRFQEQSSLTAHLEKPCRDLDHAQLKNIATLQTLEEEATQMVKKDQASQVQLEEQKVEINRIAAVLKETPDLLDTECHVQTTTKEEMEILKNLYQATVDEQLGVNSKLKAAFIKAENELKNGHLLWQQEKSSLRDQNKKACGLYHTLVKMRAESGRMEQEAKQTLQRFKAAHEGQLEEHRAETSKILAVLKKTEDQLEAERLRFQEQSSLTAHLEKPCRDLDHAQLKNIATLQTLEEEATQMVKKDQASQVQLEEQKVEINRIAAVLKETQDLLDTERHVHTTTKEDMEFLKNVCQTVVNEQLGANSKVKAAYIKAENELKNGHLLWQQEKSSLLDQNKKASGLYHTLEEEATQMVKKDQASQAQLEEQKVEINRIAAVLKETQELLDTERHVHTTTKEDMEFLKNVCQTVVNEQLGANSKLKAAYIKAENELKNGHLLWQQEKSSLLDQNKKASGLYHTLEEEATQMVKKDQASQVQLEEQRVEINRIKAARKNTEDLLETERFLWQQEKSSLLQATEDLQAIEKDLQSQIKNKQKKKKKWFKFV